MLPSGFVAIADIVSALTGTRSYKGVFSRDKTLDVITDMAREGLVDEGIVTLAADNYGTIMDSVREKTGPLLEQYQEMQDKYWDILYQIKEYQEAL